MRHGLLCFALSSLICTAHGDSLDAPSPEIAIEETKSCRYPQANRFTVRHIEGNGVGYNQGYTTFAGFIAPSQPWGKGWIPFVDLRGHLFNNGKWATNAGIGVRHPWQGRAWGASVWHDYRSTTKSHYNQVSLGLESLGTLWDFRVNGYLPVGSKTSHPFGTQFAYFKNHSMILSSKREFALKSINAEAGLHIDGLPHFPLYIAAGPYYLSGSHNTSWGGALRARWNIGDYIQLEGYTSYDSLFGWIGQGQLSLVLPFGARKKSTDACGAVATRLFQPIDRNEIIPVDRKRSLSKAINPSTQEPYFFWFVDNTSHSAGTYESPFPTLLEAQNASQPFDILYIFPGDGTSTGLDEGIALQNHQQLLGASIAHALPTTLGTVSTPVLANTLPLLTIGNTDPVITVQNYNTISGMSVTHTSGNGIGQSLSSIDGFILTHSRIETDGDPWLNLTEVSGDLQIANNTIHHASTGVIASSAFGSSSASITNNYFDTASLSLSLDGASGASLLIADNISSSATNAPFLFSFTEMSHSALAFVSNTIDNASTALNFTFSEANGNSVWIANNQINAPSSDGIDLTVSNTQSDLALGQWTLQNNQIDTNSASNGISLSMIHSNATPPRNGRINLANNAITSGGIEVTLESIIQPNVAITTNTVAGTMTLSFTDITGGNTHVAYNVINPSNEGLALTLSDTISHHLWIDHNQISDATTAIQLLATNSSLPDEPNTFTLQSNTVSASNQDLAATLDSYAQMTWNVNENTMSSESAGALITLSNNASLDASFQENHITATSDNAISLELANDSKGTIAFMHNQWHSPEPMNMTIDDNATLSFNCTDNQFLTSNTSNDGLFIEPNTTSSVTLNIQDNTFSEGIYGVEIHPLGDTMIDGTIQSNQFLNAGLRGIQLNPENNTQGVWNISNNRFTNSGMTAVNYVASDQAETCLRFLSNTASPTTTQYFISNSSSNPLRLEPLTGNIGPVETVNVTDVTAGSCSE